MNARDHSQPRRRRVLIEERTPEEIVWDYEDAIRSRAILRAQAAAAAWSCKSYEDVGKSAPKPAPEPARRTAEGRALFVAAIARAEFGRFYWSEKPINRRKVEKESVVKRKNWGRKIPG